MPSLVLGVKRIFNKPNKTNLNHRQLELDKKLVYSLSKSRVPRLSQLKYLNKYLNPRELWLIRISFSVIVLSLLFMATRFYFVNLQVVPVSGGEYFEALVGTPKYINPLYVNLNDVDNDIGKLVFSSLMRHDGEGKLVADLTESYEVSEDGKVYTFKIKKGVKWHNGSDLTVDDIIFTFHSIKDPQYKSPLRGGFSGVEIERVDDETIKFTLAESYAPFLDLMTFGVMPQDLWYQISPQGAGLAELNLKPIGSGPYKFKSLTKDKLGQIKSYSLVANSSYHERAPYINGLTFKFFGNFEEAIGAFNEGAVDGVSYVPKQLKGDLNAKNSINFYKLNLPQLTAVFLNQKKNANLADVKVRQALAFAVNKGEIAKNILHGDAENVSGPILNDSFAYNPDIRKYDHNKDEAGKLLDSAGWKITEITEQELLDIEKKRAENEEGKVSDLEEEKIALGTGHWRSKDNKFLVVKLTTVSTDENIQVVENIKKNWEELGVKTALDIIPGEQIQSDVIRPRNFEALFYGQIVGSDPDSYAFWHSSQAGSAGVNISDYANKEVDQLLEDARLTSDIEQRKEKYKRFQQIVAEEVPAIFMYSPTYTYIQSKKIKGFDVEKIQSPSDRFSNIRDWYLKTGKKLVW